MPKTPKSIVVQPPPGRSTVVDILNAAGSSLTCYTIEGGAVAHTLPLTITTDTTFWLADDGARRYSVSAKIGSREVAGAGGATQPVEFTSSSSGQIRVPVTVDALEVVDGLGSGSGTSSTSVIRGPYRVVLTELAATPGAATDIVPFDVGDIPRAMWVKEVVPYASEEAGPFVNIDTPAYQYGLVVILSPFSAQPTSVVQNTNVSDGTDALIYTTSVYTAGEYDVYIEVIPGSAYLA